MDQVRILREARGWTQQHLADASGLSLRTIQRVESGEVTPSKETFAALSGAFDVQLRADDGPHVIVKRDEDYLPGCKLNVVKDNYQVACVMEVDSRSRTVTRAGLVLLDLVDELEEGRVVFEETKEKIEISDEFWVYRTRMYLDGKLWDGLDHPVTFTYDAVLVRGPQEVISHAMSEGKIPKHWVVLPT